MGWCGHICVIDRWSRLKKRKRRTFIEFRNGFYTHADRMFKGGACTYSYCEMPMPHLLKMARRVFRPSPSLCSHQRCGIYVHKPVYLFKIVCALLVTEHLHPNPRPVTWKHWWSLHLWLAAEWPNIFLWPKKLARISWTCQWMRYKVGLNQL